MIQKQFFLISDFGKNTNFCFNFSQNELKKWIFEILLRKWTFRSWKFFFKNGHFGVTTSKISTIRPFSYLWFGQDINFRLFFLKSRPWNDSFCDKSSFYGDKTELENRFSVHVRNSRSVLTVAITCDWLRVTRRVFLSGEVPSISQHSKLSKIYPGFLF